MPTRCYSQVAAQSYEAADGIKKQQDYMGSMVQQANVLLSTLRDLVLNGAREVSTAQQARTSGDGPSMGSPTAALLHQQHAM